MRSARKELPGPPARHAPCEWYCHVPLKPSEKSEIPLPPKSQIPGLGDFMEPSSEITFGGRRKWIKDTDSEYVKLAKQGGQPDLLKYYPPTTRKSSPVAYALPDWYIHHTKTPVIDESKTYVSSMPDYMVHEEFKSEQQNSNYETKQGPFDFDVKSVWQRDAEDKENKEKKKVKLPAIKPKYPNRMQNAPTNKEFHEGNRLYFPPMPVQKNGEPVNFSKLISNGYGNDQIQQHDEGEKKGQQTPKNNGQPEDTFQPESTYTGQVKVAPSGM
ncbi:PREDICTED: uncharacterized protein C7orf57 homolog isoform X2 [Crocodylus porosus]|uniref:uncharacterized protein C7orf57 homolog isoform X2 n=1 Tax=Crocodylus porosus TaxID=8502 RepID=UPI00093B08C8|nr:PREDICTED: uncharacterized protein C7orf57 homolog isoform X2 [Crocodylus porosus]